MVDPRLAISNTTASTISKGKAISTNDEGARARAHTHTKRNINV
jgi:hypothetical protein